MKNRQTKKNKRISLKKTQKEEKKSKKRKK